MKLYTKIYSHTRFILGLLVLFIALAWTNFPSLIKWKLQDILLAQNVDLTQFEVKKPAFWFLKIDELGMASSVFKLDVSGLKINFPGGLKVEIDDLNLAILRSPGPADSSSNVVRREEVIETVLRVIDQIPSQGHIEKFTICEASCLTFSLDWVREAGEISWQASNRDFLVLSKLSRKKIELDLVGRHQYLAYISSTVDLSKPNNIVIDLRARLGGEQFLSFSSLDYEIHTDELSVDLKASIPNIGPIDIEKILAESKLKSKIRAGKNWSVSGLDFVVRNDASPKASIELSLALDDGQIIMETQSKIDVAIEVEPLSVIDVGIEQSFCHNYLNQELSCQLGLIKVRSEIEEYQLNGELKGFEVKLAGENIEIRSALAARIFDTEDPLIPIFEYDSKQVIFDGANLLIEEGVARVLGISEIQTKLQHRIESGQGSLDIVLNTEAAQLLKFDQSLSQVKISEGRVAVVSKIIWLEKEIASFSMDFSIQNLDLASEGYEIAGGQVDATLLGWPELRSLKPISMQADSLEVGASIANPKMLFDARVFLDEKKLMLDGHSLAGNLLGGSVLSHDFDLSYADSSLDGQVAIVIDSFALNELLALEGEEFESSGHLSGSVPIQIRDGKLVFEDGAVAALSPGGIIKYRPGDGIAENLVNNDSLALVIKTMSNFHYESLDIVLNYTPEGVLFAKTRLKGNNPGYEDGREIHFNLNLEENVSTLLESLRLSKELADNLDKKVKKRINSE
ncbi:MAG: hypothetical protein ACI9FB_001045 [Candidatus Azotimanducaceae bacterium]